MRRTKTCLTGLLLFVLLAGCAPRPSSWPQFPDKIAETSTWYVNAARYQQAAHDSLSCTVCHANLTETHPDPAKLTTTATELFDYEICGSCHPTAYEATRLGGHAQAIVRKSGGDIEFPVPSCGDCHNAHYSTRESRAELLTSNPETCGRCHPSELQSYLQDYHGMAAKQGIEGSATCTDCHGAHNILALHDTDEAIVACQRCHDDADASFVSRRVHD